jgi:hypothetical protein
MKLDRIDFVWLFLLAATLATWTLGERGAAGLGVMATLMVISFLKGRGVVLDFMGLRGTSLLWRALVLGWLSTVTALITLAYWLGLAS